MNPKGKHENNKTRESKSAKHRAIAVDKLQANGYDVSQSLAVGAALQHNLKQGA